VHLTASRGRHSRGPVPHPPAAMTDGVQRGSRDRCNRRDLSRGADYTTTTRCPKYRLHDDYTMPEVPTTQQLYDARSIDYTTTTRCSKYRLHNDYTTPAPLLLGPRVARVPTTGITSFIPGLSFQMAKRSLRWRRQRHAMCIAPSCTRRIEMNTRTKMRKALTLNSETLRTLAGADIAGVMGGESVTVAPTCADSCPPTRCGSCDLRCTDRC
jgi:hypothetical protein